MKNGLLFICFLWFLGARAQVYPQIGARSTGLAGTGITFNDVWSVYNNPGAFGALEKTSIGLAYENRFLLKELSEQLLAFGYHTEKNGNFGVQFQQYGFNLYREIQAGLTYGTKLYKGFYGGVAVNFHSVILAENYSSRNTASASLGLLYELSDELQFAVRVQNISRSTLSEFQDERFPTRFGLGATYNFSEAVLWTIEAEKDLLQPINIKSGLEIHPQEVIYLRLGVNSFPFQSSFGVGLKLDKLQFDIATLWHSTLGVSPSAGLKYQFN